MSAGRAQFTAPALPTRVVFGAGAVSRLADECDAAGLDHILVLCTPGGRRLAEQVAGMLGDRCTGIHAGARMHVPVAAIAQAQAAAERLGARGCVAVGGGSAIGLAKALARDSGLPYAAVATTYAGSEMTPVWGTTDGQVKTTGRDERVRPRTVLYDPALTTALPVDVSMASGLNAMAHAAEALYAPDGNPLVDLFAVEGVTAMVGALPKIAADPGDVDARSRALYGAWLCGMCLGSTTMSLHHKLCHALGGAYDLPHAQTHAVLLPYTLAFNLPAAPEASRSLVRALRDDDPAGALWRLDRAVGVPGSLRELGLPAAGIERVADAATAAPYPNPRPVDRDAVTAILTAAYQGDAPTGP